MPKSPDSHPRTLADQFRSWSGEQLTSLLEARPDLGFPAPKDSRQLAARAVTNRSVRPALDSLNAFQLLVLQALCQDQHLPGPAPEIDAATDELVGLGLAWGDPVVPTNMVRDLLQAPPGPARVDLSSLSAAQVMLLHKLDESHQEGVLTATTGPGAELVEAGLLVRRGTQAVQLPWSVRLALRASQRRELHQPPSLATSQVDPKQVDRVAAGAALEFCRRVEALLDLWGKSPPPALRNGGLGIRDLRATAKALHLDETEAALVIEVAHAAGLLAHGGTDELGWAHLPTDDFDTWQGHDTLTRWLRLARAWLSTEHLIGLVGARLADKPVNALTPELNHPWAPALRQDILAQLPHAPGLALAASTGLPTLRGRLHWIHPRRPIDRLDQLPQLLNEAATLGLTGLGALSSLGRALSPTQPSSQSPGKSPEDEQSDLSALFPAPVEHVILQADHTAVAPGPLTPELTRTFGLLGEVESTGGATVYRFTEGSIRRGFDAGWSAAELHDFFTRVSQTPAPQSLSYLIDDLARRFGTLRVGRASSFLRSDDPEALAELLHHPLARTLRLRPLAPTVAVTDLPLNTVIDQLREAGMAPVVESPDGVVQLTGVQGHRTHTPKRAAHAPIARRSAQIQAAVRAIQAGDRAAADSGQLTEVKTPADIIALLHQALDTGEELVIGYVGNDGVSWERPVRPIRVEGGQLLAHDSRSGHPARFVVHRITFARPMGSPPTPHLGRQT